MFQQEEGRRTTGRRSPRSRASRRFVATALLPAWAFLVLLIGYPLLKVLVDGFSHSNLVNPSVSGFAGVENYSDVLADPHFSGAVRNSLVWTIGSVVGEYALGLGSAVLLNRRLRGRGVFRMLSFIRWLVPIIVA